MGAVGSSRTSGARRRAIINMLARQQGPAGQIPSCNDIRQQHFQRSSRERSSSSSSSSSRRGIGAFASTGRAAVPRSAHIHSTPPLTTHRHSTFGWHSSRRMRGLPHGQPSPIGRATRTVRSPTRRNAPATQRASSLLEPLDTLDTLDTSVIMTWRSARPVLAGWSRRATVAWMHDMHAPWLRAGSACMR